MAALFTVPVLTTVVSRLTQGRFVAGIGPLYVLIAGVCMAWVSWRIVFVPSDALLRRTIDDSAAAISAMIREQEELKSTFETQMRGLEFYESRYQSLLKAFECRLNQLRSADWRLMQGVDFEVFLADVLREWGFQVALTKASGDQGVDLIASRAGRRMAIQAKGYPRSTVGNKAVQEAHTGMVFYNCTECVVITNSTFTAAAKQLALSVNCRLIDGDAIHDLIEGRIIT